jgi:ELWxxDGT repeat protein
MKIRVSSLASSTCVLLFFIVLFVGCGGGGGGGDDGDGSLTPADYLLFYGDNTNNTNPDTSGDGLFKIQDGVLRLLKIINPVGKSHVQDFTDFGDLVIFSACNAWGCEPWITDGTSEGTALLKDINPLGDSNPADYTLFEGEIYFSADDGRHGVELWKTDGTGIGTVMVKNIGIEDSLSPFPAPVSSDPQELTVFNDALFFVANDIDYENHGQGVELWKTDGTEAGTVIVKNIAIEDPSNPAQDPDTPIDSDPRNLTVFNGALYFVATDGRYGLDRYGVEPWKTDGTEANTIIVKNIGINPINASLSYDSSPEQFTVFNNELYFFADDGLSGFEPWKTDGDSNTDLVRNIGIDNGTPFPSSPDNLTYWAEAGGRLFFTAETGNSGIEPYTTDGTSTAKLDDLNVVPGRDDVFRVFNDRMFFFADDGTHGFELWVSNGTLSGADLIKDIYATPINSPVTAGGLKFLTEYQGQLFFTADDGFVGTEVWVTQGTEISTGVLKDIGPGNESGYADAFGPEKLDGVLWFSAFDGGTNIDHGVEMWRTLGTEAETQLVEDLNPGPQDGVLTASSFPLP